MNIFQWFVYAISSAWLGFVNKIMGPLIQGANQISSSADKYIEYAQDNFVKKFYCVLPGTRSECKDFDKVTEQYRETIQDFQNGFLPIASRQVGIILGSTILIAALIIALIFIAKD